MTLFFGIIFAIFAVAMRMIPHMPNFVPMGALALWGGAYLSKKWSLALPIAAMLASDAVVGFYDWRLMFAVYGSLILIVVLGWWLKGNKDSHTVVLSSLSGSVAFFFITNFAVWLLSAWYPHTLSGLSQAYVMGMPFFRGTLLGDLVYNGAFFGIYALAVMARKANQGSLMHSQNSHAIENPFVEHLV